jgi:hypothetical protein
MLTRDTHKFGLASAIRLRAMPTRTTRATGIARVKKDYRHSDALRFVFDTLPQMSESPVAMPSSLRFPNRNPLANTREFLKGYRSLCAFGFRNQRFCYSMIGVFLKSPLFAGEFFQAALGVPRAGLLNFCATKDLAIGIGGNVHNAQIYSECRTGLHWWRIGNITRGVEIGGTIATNKVAFAFLSAEQVGVMLTAARKRHGQAPLKCPNRNRMLEEVPRENPRIVSNCAKRSEGALGFGAQFVGIGNFAQAAHDDLGGKPKLITNTAVQALVKFVGRKNFMLKGFGRNSITGSIGSLHGFKQSRKLFGRSVETYLGGEFHTAK